jgi:hypothetical protein
MRCSIQGGVYAAVQCLSVAGVFVGECAAGCAGRVGATWFRCHDFGPLLSWVLGVFVVLGPPVSHFASAVDYRLGRIT